MAVLTVNIIDRGGRAYESDLVAAAAGGDSFPNTGKEIVVVANGGGSSITVTLVCQSTVDGQPVTSRTVTIAAGAKKMIGPFPMVTYNDTNARMNFTYSSVTSVTIAAFSPTTL